MSQAQIEQLTGEFRKGQRTQQLNMYHTSEEQLQKTQIAFAYVWKSQVVAAPHPHASDILSELTLRARGDFPG